MWQSLFDRISIHNFWGYLPINIGLSRYSLPNLYLHGYIFLLNHLFLTMFKYFPKISMCTLLFMWQSTSHGTKF
jgi:hypothetical protein